jgi:hypothetical protein
VSSTPSASLGYYPGLTPAPIGNPYSPQAYYPPYGSIPPSQPGSRPPYGMYPQLHHQPPPGIFAPPHQNIYAVSNPNIYQIPPPPLAYGSIQQLVQTMPPEIYHPQMMESIRNLNEQAKPYIYEQQRPYA